jgi:hypothetical protein
MSKKHNKINYWTFYNLYVGRDLSSTDIIRIIEILKDSVSDRGEEGLFKKRALAALYSEYNRQMRTKELKRKKKFLWPFAFWFNTIFKPWFHRTFKTKALEEEILILDPSLALIKGRIIKKWS